MVTIDDEELKYWIWLTQIPKVGLVSRNELLRIYESPREIYHGTFADLEEAVERKLKPAQLESILASRSLIQAEATLAECHRFGIRILTREHPIIRKTFALQNETPTLLYAKGKLEKIGSTVGIVGARRCTQETKLFTRDLALNYVKQGTVIISGMAKGVDAYAQTACVNAGGITVAVLGCGVDICYPAEHRALMDRIMETGLVLSEYPPGTLPARYHFPKRNRLIAALSDKLMVISAGRGSGAMITADVAEKMGKIVEYKVSG